MATPLILYFSVYGSTRKFAETISRETGGTLQELIPAEPYDSNRDHYHSLSRLAKEEHRLNRRPALAHPVDLSLSEQIFVGYPVWWYTFPMVVYTLFGQYDFRNKTVVPFNTHMGSGDGDTYATIRNLAPNARVLEGLPLPMSEAENGGLPLIRAWLDRIGRS